MGSSGSFNAEASTSIKFKSTKENTKEDIEEVLRFNVMLQIPMSEDHEDYDEYSPEYNYEKIAATPEDLKDYDLKRIIRAYKEAPDYMKGLDFVVSFGDVWGYIYYENDNSESSTITNKSQKDLLKHINSGLITLEEVLKGFTLDADGSAE